MASEVIYPSEGVNIIIEVWHKMGAWPQKSSPIVYYIYGITVHTLFTYLMPISIGIYPLFQMDIQQSSEDIYNAISDISYFLMFNFMLYRRNDIQKLLTMLDDNLKADANTLTDYEKRHILDGISKGRKLFQSLVTLFLCSAFMINFKTLLKNNYSTPFQPLLPFEFKNSELLFWLVYGWLGFGIFFQVTNYAGLNTFASSAMLVLGGYCDALGYNFESIGNINEINGTIVDHKQFKKMMKQYTKITFVARMIEKTFSENLFIEFGLSGLILCLTLFKLSTVSVTEDMASFIFMIVFGISILTQVSIPCYFGNEVVVKTQKFVYQIYSSNWMNMHVSYKKDITTFMSMIQRPIMLSAAHLFYLRLDTLKSILNTSYSTYAVLRRNQTK